MAKVTLHGYRRLDFTNKSGEAVDGMQLFISCADDTVTGEMTGKMFVRTGVPLPSLKPGMVLDVEYNHRGKPIRIEALSEPQSRKINLNGGSQ